ncbi:DUF5685 family protein [Nocardia bovistercoris]|uniref:Regulator n=1 Tax=Nocardia bovistercoris TaxID=2785916 RepID=A0A931IDW9_9NOCA|nr:DUF5685 family protein [Nocardia bovistercoris]MBH0778726.1 regulator [Nocardia bovistercoris]
MFGLLTPCAHGAHKYGIDPSEWHAQMCGLCVGLGAGHGSLARTATNTDAMLLNALTEAQFAGPAARTGVGPCALRGMRRAEVAAADSPGVRLAATASLLLGAAKIRDHVDDADTASLLRRPMATVSGQWWRRARAQAASIDLDVEPLVAAIAAQGALERTSGLTLDELTEPAQRCAAEFFAHTAVLAGRADNVEPLRTAGRHFGRIAHLADAVEDLDDDIAHGRYNPLVATGTDLDAAYEQLLESEAALREAIATTDLDTAPTVRWMLLDPLSSLLTGMGRDLGLVNHHPYDSHRAPRKPTLIEGIGLLLGQYPTGYACFADHTRPCSGRRKRAWRKRLDCCDCADCCCDCS